MLITNNHNLPEPLYNAIVKKNYDRGDSDFTATELIGPPRIRMLKKAFDNVLTKDAMDLIWVLLGVGIHKVIEEANTSGIVERRYYALIDGYKVSAQVDYFIPGLELHDWKVTSAYKFAKNEPPSSEWIQQLNIQLHMIRENNENATKLFITGILRDFSLRQSAEEINYPDFQVGTHNIPIWPKEKTLSFIRERIRLHLEAEKVLPLCSDDDRWSTKDKFAIIRGTNKKATKLVDSMPEALDYIANLGPGHRIEFRKGEPRRCRLYCDVSKHCSQYQQSINQGVKSETVNS